MYWCRLKSAVITGLVGLACSATATATVIECPILQVKLGRFYFPVGLEEFVYPDCRFTIAIGSDTVCTGRIARSYEGVSFSYEMDLLPDSLIIDSCRVFIGQADVDSSGLSIGAVGRLPVLDALPSNIRSLRFPSRMAMLSAFRRGEIDAFISYRAGESVVENSATISTPAPYFAALIPNVGKGINQNGFLTTSMYYCFDPNRPSLYFDGDDVAPHHRLLSGDGAQDRFYRHDPGKGRRLLRNIRSRLGVLQLVCLDESLARLAEYFADILSRERFRIGLKGKQGEADLYLTFLPVDVDEPGAALDSLICILAADTVDGRTINKAVAVCGDWLEMSAEAADSSGRFLYMERAAATLMEDISLFPLFRPSLFFTAHSNIKGHRFDRSGHLDLSEAVRIVLPTVSSGDSL